MLTYLILLALLLLLSAFFSSSETAFLSLQRVRLEHQVREGVPGAARVSALLDRPQRLLSAILLGNNLVNTGAAAVGTAIAAELVSGGEAIIAATVAVTVLLVLFGEVGPKTTALSHSMTMSRAYALPMAGWVRLTRPIGWLLDQIARLLLHALGGTPSNDTALNAAELRTAIRLGAESGSIQTGESSLLLGALTLQQRQVQEIMVSRVDMVAVEADEPVAAVAEQMAASGFLRLPVYDQTPDEIVGYVHVSDLNSAWLAGFGDRTASDVMRPPTFESEHASIARVLEVMQEHASYLVMLVDEFGATSGLVTLEDITEEVVGDLRSESGEEAASVCGPAAKEGPRVVEGSHLLVDLSNELDVDLTDIDANTVAGLVLAYLQRFPDRGDYVEHAGYRFTVREADERRVTLVQVEPAAAANGAESLSSSSAGGPPTRTNAP